MAKSVDRSWCITWPTPREFMGPDMLGGHGQLWRQPSTWVAAKGAIYKHYMRLCVQQYISHNETSMKRHISLCISFLTIVVGCEEGVREKMEMMKRAEER